MHDTATELFEDLVVVGVDPKSGRIRLGRHADLLVEAAILVDLVRAGRVAPSGTGAKTRIHVADPRPLDEPVLDEALAWCARTQAPPTASDLAELEAASWLTRKVVGWAMAREKPGASLESALAGFSASQHAQEHLASTGVLGQRERRPWEVVRPRFVVCPPERRDRLVEDLRAVLLDGRQPDARTGPLLGLLGAGRLFGSTSNGAPHLARWARFGHRFKTNQRAKALVETLDEVAGVGVVIDAARAIVDDRSRSSGD